MMKFTEMARNDQFIHNNTFFDALLHFKYTGSRFNPAAFAPHPFTLHLDRT